MHRGRKIAVGVIDAPVVQVKVNGVVRTRMTAEEFADVASRIRRVVSLSAAARHANADGVLAAAAATAFNAGVPEARRYLLLAQGQLSVFGVVREEVASQLRRLAEERDEQHAALLAEHRPLLS